MSLKLSNQAADDLGFRKRFRILTVCMPVSIIRAVGDVVTLEKTFDELNKIQKFRMPQERNPQNQKLNKKLWGTIE